MTQSNTPLAKTAIAALIALAFLACHAGVSGPVFAFVVVVIAIVLAAVVVSSWGGSWKSNLRYGNNRFDMEARPNDARKSKGGRREK